MKPKNLAEIWDEAWSPYFRVRDVDTLEDYVILGVCVWMQNRPYAMVASKCDEYLTRRQQLSCMVRKWALLSSKEEIKYFKNMQEIQIIFQSKKPYRSGIE